MTQSYTPGPLTIEPVDHLGDPAWAVLAMDGDYTAVGCLKGDARLYAAAPELYQAAIRLIHLFAEIPSLKNNDVAWGAFSQGVAAIAKAEGKTRA